MERFSVVNTTTLAKFFYRFGAMKILTPETDTVILNFI
jgi:hypothetical protein